MSSMETLVVSKQHRRLQSCVGTGQDLTTPYLMRNCGRVFCHYTIRAYARKYYIGDLGACHMSSRPVLIGASLSEPHTSVIYGTTCIDRPYIWNVCNKNKGPNRHIRSLFRAEIRMSFMYISPLVFVHIRQFCALVLRNS